MKEKMGSCIKNDVDCDPLVKKTEIVKSNYAFARPTKRVLRNSSQSNLTVRTYNTRIICNLLQSSRLPLATIFEIRSYFVSQTF